LYKPEDAIGSSDKVIVPKQVRDKLCNEDAVKKIAGIKKKSFKKNNTK